MLDASVYVFSVSDDCPITVLVELILILGRPPGLMRRSTSGVPVVKMEGYGASRGCIYVSQKLG